MRMFGGSNVAKRLFKRIGLVLITLLLLLVLVVLASYINHRNQLRKEDSAFVPIGHQVEVNGHWMNVYSEGTGEKTIVFMSGAGTCSPVLDFKSLYSLLSKQYRVVVVEKAGYGFSEDSNAARDIHTILSETRQALSLAGISAPFVLCPHSMSGIEALYWAQQYPKEVTAIIGLDMSVPAAYKNMKINIPLMRLGAFAANVGITRWIPSLSESDAIQHGTLTQKEKDLYQIIFYRRTVTTAMINEAQEIKKSAETVAAGATVSVPILIFSSNGSGGTGFDTNTWRSFHRKFIQSVPNGKIIELDCPHYVHDYEYEKIAKATSLYLSKLTK